MALFVKKFGGSSVANADKLLNVAKIITKCYSEGNDVVVVVSAQGDTTDDLLEKAREVNPKPSAREMDVLLSTGEQQSMALLAMTIETLGFPVISLTGWQAGIRSDSNYRNARIKNIDPERVNLELNKKNIVIVAGFQGLNKYDDITTLGRGASDAVAVALAAVLKADMCQIYTDVDGVYTADPRIVKNAHKLDEISYAEMLELASLGAQVLQNRSVELAQKYNISLEVRSSFSDKPGTIVKEVPNMEKMLVKGVARDDNVASISVFGVPDLPGVAYKIFSLLASKKINVDIILQSNDTDMKRNISFTVTKDNLEAALTIIRENLTAIGAREVSFNDAVSKISIVGAGMVNNPGVAAIMFEALYDAGVNIDMISTSEMKISVIIPQRDSEKTLIAIHDRFNLQSAN